MVLYQYQFYLLAKHPCLQNIGSKVLKNYYTSANYTYADNGLEAQPTYYTTESIANNNTNLQAYIYCL